MINYKDILNNEYIKNEYSKIDEINPYAFSHGLKHVNNVCNNMLEICNILNIEESEKDALLIACALHDVGQADGREHHGYKAKEIAIKLFDKELKENSYYEQILEAIEKHEMKNNCDNSLFTILLQLADTLDFSDKRLVDNYTGEYSIYPWKYIKNIELLKTDKGFGINISTENIHEFSKLFLQERFTSKIISIINVISEKLGMKPVIKINNEILNLDNYIILHGSAGSCEGNWFPWLKKKILDKNFKVDVPQMPIGIGNQNYFNWEREFNKLLINENTTIIAHSIAPIFVCKYLITNKIKVKKLIFVCGFNNYLGINEEYDAVNKPMFIDNYKDVTNYCNDIVCYYSDNDPYLPFEVEKQFADDISNKQFVIFGGGHINSESGYTSFEKILEEI